MAGEFDSAWLKFGWAYTHGQSLQAGIAANASGDPSIRIGHKYHPKLHAFVLSVEWLDPPPVTWGLHLGDFVNCQRSALDHIAWALVRRGKTPNLPEKQLRSVHFPLLGDRDKLKAAIPERLPGVRAADLTIVRKHQPYQAGRRNVTRRCVETLQTLVNYDKHREIQPVWALPERSVYRVTPTDCVARRVTPFPGRALKVGTEVSRVYVRKTGPNPDIKVQGEFTTKPALNNGIWLEDFLNQTIRFVGVLLTKFSEPPEEFFSLGIAGPSPYLEARP